MNTKPITEYSQKALKNISVHLKFSQYDTEPVSKEITFSNYTELSNAVYSIFSAIETIGFNGETGDLVTCAGLAQLGRKLMPINEMQFLDSLLIKNEVLNSNLDFKEIK
jgi:hypothetical protein